MQIFKKSWQKCIICYGRHFGCYERACVAPRMIQTSRRGARLLSEQATATYGLAVPSLSLFLQEQPGCCFLLTKTRYACHRHTDAAAEPPLRVRRGRRWRHGGGFGCEVVWHARATAFNRSLNCHLRHRQSCLCGKDAYNVGKNYIKHHPHRL